MVYKSKVCRSCDKEYIPTNGRQVVCAECKYRYHYNRSRRWLLSHKDKVKIYFKKYRNRNVEVIREKDRIAKRLWRKEHPEISLQQQRNWRIKNAQKHRDNNKKWRRENKKKVYFWNKQRKIRERGVVGKHSFKEWEDLKKKHNYMCLACKKFEPEIKLTEDHIVPLFKGGTNNINNIQPLCGRCNSIKHLQEINYGI